MTGFGRLAPGLTAKLNLGYDHLAVPAAMILSTAALGDGAAGGPLLAAAALATILWAIAGSALQLYDPWVRRDAFEDAALLSLLILLEGGALALARWALPGLELPAAGSTLLALAALAIAPRLLLFRPLGRGDAPLDEVLVIGTGPLGRCTGEELGKTHPRRQVLGHLLLPGEPRAGQLPERRILGDLSDLERCIRTFPMEEVFIAGNPSRDGEAMREAVRVCERYGIPFALPAIYFPFERSRPISGLAVADGYLHFVPFDVKARQRALKRLFDIAASAVALAALSPLLLSVAAAIKLTSRGPVFFRQERVGLHGRPFRMLKFRSMVANAEAIRGRLEGQNEQAGPVFKIQNDPRVTGVGRFLRKYSVDELPQLLNVLRGEMSIVGPRPPLSREVAQYEPWQRRRLSVRPGLTCIWQVSGRNQISFDEWMYLDMRYIDHWTLRGDLALVLKTVPVVLTGKGAS